VAEQGCRLEADATGTRLRIYVVDAKGNEVKPEHRDGWPPDSNGPELA
jgi:hypothetical protein